MGEIAPDYLPCSAELARDILEALRGVLFKEDASFKRSLDEILADPKSHFGVRLLAAKEGPGIYDIDDPLAWSVKDSILPQGLVYATINTMQCLAGSCSTYKFKRDEEGKLKYIGSKTHAMS